MSYQHESWVTKCSYVKGGRTASAGFVLSDPSNAVTRQSPDVIGKVASHPHSSTLALHPAVFGRLRVSTTDCCIRSFTHTHTACDPLPRDFCANSSTAPYNPIKVQNCTSYIPHSFFPSFFIGPIPWGHIAVPSVTRCRCRCRCRRRCRRCRCRGHRCAGGARQYR